MKCESNKDAYNFLEISSIDINDHKTQNGGRIGLNDVMLVRPVICYPIYHKALTMAI